MHISINSGQLIYLVGWSGFVDDRSNVSVVYSARHSIETIHELETHAVLSQASPHHNMYHKEAVRSISHCVIKTSNLSSILYHDYLLVFANFCRPRFVPEKFQTLPHPLLPLTTHPLATQVLRTPFHHYDLMV